MTKLNESYELVGKVLTLLVRQGLSQQTIRTQDIIEEHLDNDTNEAYRTRDFFCSIMEWLLSEELITGHRDHFFTFHKVQLTAKGLAALQSPNFAQDEEISIAAYAENHEGDLGSDTYGKI